VSVLDPVPVAGPRTVVRWFCSGCIGSKAGARGGLLHPQHRMANTPAAAVPSRAFRLTCRAYQARRPAVNGVLLTR